MAIPTSRTKVNAEIRIHTEICKGCGLCVSVCNDDSIKISNNKVIQSDNPFFGCIGCGHCMAVCPNGAIEIYGRETSPADLFDLPKKTETVGFNQFLNTLKLRRSVREFSEEPVSREMIDSILEASMTAPMGLPPSDVNVLILSSKEEVRRFAVDYCNYLKGMKWFVSNFFLAIMRPFWGKSSDELFRGFIKPLFKTYTENMDKGINLVTYDAPLAMYFYGTPFCDPADPLIAATYAMLAGETLGLGTCMLGGIHPLIQNGGKAAKLREKWGIKGKSREGLFVIFGHPKVKYHKGIRRTFASVTFSSES